MPTDKLLEDVQSYAILTEEIGSGRAPRPATPGSPGSPGTSQLGQMVDGALREVLGWRPRSTDAQGFVAALNQSFSVKEVQGHIEWKWTPRSYAVAAELGAVTGAQASIYSRAKAMLDQSLPLLEGLHPLNADFDKEDADAIRAIVKSSLTELVAELGREGGPRVARVDELFFQLFDTDDVNELDDTENLDGQLGLLRIRFGLERKFVNKIEEEQNQTNYLIVADNTISLRISWEHQKELFELGATDVFLGTQTVLLSRALAVVAESVEETYFVMDSVFLGSAERQVLKLKFHTTLNLPSIFLGDLLSWVELFATDEGPRLIRDGGKDGVIEAFSKTADKLAKLVAATKALSAGGGGGGAILPDSFRTARVSRALKELSDQLENVSNLAEQIKREPRSEPVVLIVSPDRSAARDDLRLVIVGEDFRPGMLNDAVKLIGPSPGQCVFKSKEVIVQNDKRLVAEFDLVTPSEAAPGWYTIGVTNPDQGSGKCEDAFEITAGYHELQSKPVVITVGPDNFTAKNDLRLVIVGEDFRPGISNKAVRLIGPSYSPQTFESKKVTVQNGICLVAEFDLRSASPGRYAVEVTNPDQGSGKRENALEITAPHKALADEITLEEAASGVGATVVEIAPEKAASDVGATVVEIAPEKPASEAGTTPKNKSKPSKT